MKMMTLCHHLIQRETSGLTFLRIVLILKVTCALVKSKSESKIHVECTKCGRVICFFVFTGYFYSVSHGSPSEENRSGP